MGIKYAVNESFFESWNQKMAYVLGYIYADGSLENAPYIRGRYLRITSTDKSIILKIKKWINSQHIMVTFKFPKNSNRKTRYILRIGSHKIYNSLVRLGVYPNKSLTVKLPEIPVKFLADFVRGYFDGDGCVHIYKTLIENTGRESVKRIVVVFTSGSVSFLEKLGFVLKSKLVLGQGKVYMSHRSFQLRYSTNDTVKIFKFLYEKCRKDGCLERKFDVFNNYFRLCPHRIDATILRILKNYHLNGAVAK